MLYVCIFIQCCCHNGYNLMNCNYHNDSYNMTIIMMIIKLFIIIIALRLAYMMMMLMNDSFV